MKWDPILMLSTPPAKIRPGWTPPVDSAHQMGPTTLLNDLPMIVRALGQSVNKNAILTIFGDVSPHTSTGGDAGGWTAPFDAPHQTGLITLLNDILIAVAGTLSVG